MSIKNTAASIAALALLAGAPAIVLAEPSVSEGPIAVSDYQVQASELDTAGPGGVSVTFQNTSDKTATDIVFDVVDPSGAIVATYDDQGTFSPGVTVNQSFAANVSSGELRIAAVKFDDGSVWGNG